MIISTIIEDFLINLVESVYVELKIYVPRLVICSWLFVQSGRLQSHLQETQISKGVLK